MMEADKKVTDWSNVLASIIEKIKNRKQRPSVEKICLSVRKQKPGLSNDFISNHLKDAVLKGKLVKSVKNGQTSYDIVSNQLRPHSDNFATEKAVGDKSLTSSKEGLAKNISRNKSSLLDSKISNNYNKHPSKCSPSEFLLLDVVWAQMSGYPSWPAMVRTSPEHIFRRENKIHVQFFGDLSRAWVSKHKMKIFSPAKNKEKQSKGKLKKALMESIEEAKEVYNLPREEREGYLIPMKVGKLEVVPNDSEVDVGMTDIGEDREDCNAEKDKSKNDSVDLEETVKVPSDETKDISNKIIIHGSMDETDEDICIEDMYSVVPEEGTMSKVLIEDEDTGKIISYASLNHLKNNIDKMSSIRRNIESPILSRENHVSKYDSQSPTSSVSEVESPYSRGCHSTTSSKDNLINGYNSQDQCTPPQDVQYSEVSQQDSPYSEVSRSIQQNSHQDSPFLETSPCNFAHASASPEQRSPQSAAGTAVGDFKRWMESSYPRVKEDGKNNIVGEDSYISPIYVTPTKTTSEGQSERKNGDNYPALNSNEDGTKGKKKRFGYPTSTPNKHVAPGIKRIKLARAQGLQPIQQESTLDGSSSPMEKSSSDYSVSEDKVQIPATNEHPLKVLPKVINVGEESEKDLNNRLQSFSSNMDLPQNVLNELLKLSQNAEGASPKFKVELTVTSKQLLGLKLLGFI